MTHGLRILQALRSLMASLCRKPSDVESAAVIDGYLAENAVKLKRVKKPGTPKLRARDAVFDLLARLDGVSDTTKLTRHGGARIATAKSQILEVMPERTTDEVCAEINARWGRWCRKHADAKVQTVMALVTHWAELGGGPKTQAALVDIMQEPDGDWRQVMAVLYRVPKDCEGVQRPWHEISPEYRSAILKDIAKNGRVSA